MLVRLKANLLSVQHLLTICKAGQSDQFLRWLVKVVNWGIDGKGLLDPIEGPTAYSFCLCGYLRNATVTYGINKTAIIDITSSNVCSRILCRFGRDIGYVTASCRVGQCKSMDINYCFWVHRKERFELTTIAFGVDKISPVMFLVVCFYVVWLLASWSIDWSDAITLPGENPLPIICWFFALSNKDDVRLYGFVLHVRAR